MSILRRFLGPLMTNGWVIAKSLGIANTCADRTLAPIEDCPDPPIKRRSDTDQTMTQRSNRAVQTAKGLDGAS